MVEKFDLAEKLRYETTVSKSRIRLNDRRTGEIHEVVVFHPGEVYPAPMLRRICEEYGFGLISCNAEDAETGILEWSDIFSAMKMRKGMKDDRSQL